jgi:glycosyltransferase involved in cell wall biosynthesis
MTPPAAHDQPLVSVVIATYNMGKFVASSIESVLGQTWSNIEVVVVDDGSTDDTLDRLAAYRTDPRVTVVVQQNLGQPRAKNAGLSLAKGSFIAFCDADDMWLPHKLATQIPIFSKDPRIGVVYSSIKTLPSKPEDGESAHLHRGEILEALFLRNFIPFGTAVIRRECLLQSGFFDESISMGIDWDLWLRIALHWRFDFTPDPTYVYRSWEGQMSRNWRGRYDHAFIIMDRFLTRYPERLPSNIVATAYADTYTNLAREELRNVGMPASLATLRKALRKRVTFWPAWRLMLLMPLLYFRMRRK